MKYSTYTGVEVTVNVPDEVPEDIGMVTASVTASKTEDPYHVNLTTGALPFDDVTRATGKLYHVTKHYNSIYSFIHTDGSDFKHMTHRIAVPANHNGGLVEMVNVTEVIDDRRIELNENFVLRGEFNFSCEDGYFVDAESPCNLHRIITIIDNEIGRKNFTNQLFFLCVFCSHPVVLHMCILVWDYDLWYANTVFVL